MEITILLYEAMTALDAIGPYEVLAQLPGAHVQFVARERGLVRTDTRALGLMADRAIGEVERTDILLLPGGPGDETARRDAHTLDWLRAIHPTTTWTTSVCTGSLILGAAGLLRGLPATTHWFRLDALREYGAIPTSERVVEAGKIVTAAGVSAGIDMALRLVQRIAGDDLARAIQLGIEYDPQPPFDGGSVEKTPPHVVAMLREVFETVMHERRADAARQAAGGITR